jgi:hypothetical protein
VNQSVALAEPNADGVLCIRYQDIYALPGGEPQLKGIMNEAIRRAEAATGERWGWFSYQFDRTLRLLRINP